MKKKVHKLDYKPEFEFDLIGISSHENDYRVSWALNNNLNTRLTRDNDLEIKTTGNEEIAKFSKYAYHEEEDYISYYLIANRCNNAFLLEEFKNLDFFLLMKGEYGNHFIEDLVKKIKQINIITIAFNIDLSTIKSKSKLKLIF